MCGEIELLLRHRRPFKDDVSGPKCGQLPYDSRYLGLSFGGGHVIDLRIDEITTGIGEVRSSDDQQHGALTRRSVAQQFRRVRAKSRDAVRGDREPDQRGC